MFLPKSQKFSMVRGETSSPNSILFTIFDWIPPTFWLKSPSDINSREAVEVGPSYSFLAKYTGYGHATTIGENDLITKFLNLGDSIRHYDISLTWFYAGF